MVNQNWDKTFELQNTTVMSALLDCQIMNIYCIMKMWWHLEQSHLTLSSRASVSPSLSANAFCSKGCILKDSGRNVSQSRHTAWEPGSFQTAFWILESTHTHTYTHKGALSFTSPSTSPFFSYSILSQPSSTLNISVGLPLSMWLLWR